MDRAEFMRRLSALLQDVPPAEREEALQYYNDYFDDAGEGNEAGIIASLGTPEELAKSIQAGLADGGNAGEFTESGFRGYEQRNKFQVMSTDEERDAGQDNARKSAQDRGFGGSPNGRQPDGTGGENGAYERQADGAGGKNGAYGWQADGAGGENGANGRQAGQSGKQGRPMTGGQIALIVLLAILTFPVWIGLLGGLLGCVLGLFGALLGLFIAFLAVGVVFLAVGVSLVISGIAAIFGAPLAGLCLVGVGLILTALGLVFACLMVWTIGSAVPALIRGTVNLCRRIFHRGGARA